MKLAAIDIGNSKVKVALYPRVNSEATETQSASFPSVVEAMESDMLREARGGGFCTTRHLSAEEKSLLEANGFWELTATRRLPLKINYRTPGTLGVDRIAAAIAAADLYPGKTVLVADIGTALTTDVVCRGEFMGGNISPGLMMRTKALHKFTSRLPLVEPAPDVAAFGSDTVTAIQAGAMWGMVWELKGALAVAAEAYGCEGILLTGGGMSDIIGALTKSLPEKFFIQCNPGLVEDGIMLAYLYNHEI